MRSAGKGYLGVGSITGERRAGVGDSGSGSCKEAGTTDGTENPDGGLESVVGRREAGSSGSGTEPVEGDMSAGGKLAG